MVLFHVDTALDMEAHVSEVLKQVYTNMFKFGQYQVTATPAAAEGAPLPLVILYICMNLYTFVHSCG